jgi:hypothetical protein
MRHNKTIVVPAKPEHTTLVYSHTTCDKCKITIPSNDWGTPIMVTQLRLETPNISRHDNFEICESCKAELDEAMTKLGYVFNPIR